MPQFEAIVKIKDIYGGNGWTKKKIAAVLINNLEEDADIVVLEIIQINILKSDEINSESEKQKI